MRPEVLADALATVIRGLVAPLALRVASLEAAQAGDAAIDTLAASLGELRAQVAILDARAPLPGPPGPQGPPGADGRAGEDGKSLSYLGVHVAGKTYDAGDLVTEDGSVFYCARTTTAKPGTTHDWQLMVKRGRDARGGPR
jgi:hypothetical protein